MKKIVYLLKRDWHLDWSWIAGVLIVAGLIGFGYHRSNNKPLWYIGATEEWVIQCEGVPDHIYWEDDIKVLKWCYHKVYFKDGKVVSYDASKDSGVQGLTNIGVK